MQAQTGEVEERFQNTLNRFINVYLLIVFGLFYAFIAYFTYEVASLFLEQSTVIMGIGIVTFTYVMVGVVYLATKWWMMVVQQ